MAFELLDGFGDAGLGEWIEDRPQAFHLRRRLTEKEQERIGGAVDCRNTEEGMRRLAAIRDYLPEPALLMAAEELAVSRAGS